MDIRVPIGLMFSILGALLTVFGIATWSETELYIRSLNINVNLWWGLVQLVFGSIMLHFGRAAERALKERIARGEFKAEPGRGGH